MRPLHTAARSTEYSTLRKASSRTILQIQEGSPGESSRQRPLGPGPKSSSIANRCDTLFIILGIAVFLSIVGMLFVHRLFLESSAASDSLLNQETRATGHGQGNWGSQHSSREGFYR
jgi:hypothetical protein